MRISLVVPSYNHAAFLPDCLDSLLAQNDPDLEILVYDGGSTDTSTEIIRAREDRLAYWQSESDGGQAAALRAGFSRATGDWLGWVNSDDLLLPGALTSVRAATKQHPDAVLLYGDALWIDANNRILRPKREIEPDWSIFAYGYSYLPQPSTFFRRDAYETAGGIDANLRCCMDSDLWHRLFQPGRVAHIPAFLSGLRDHPATKTNQLGEIFKQEHMLLRERYLHCGATLYTARHIWHRLRRLLIRWQSGCYAPLTPEEARTCALPIQ